MASSMDKKKIYVYYIQEMPTRTRRRYRKRRNYKKRRFRKKQFKLPIGGFTDSKVVKLRWVQPLTLDAGSGSYAYKTIVANGAFEPYGGDNTHQPSNFDIWNARYKSYTVIGAKITVSFTPQQTTGLIPSYVGIYKTQDINELPNIMTNYGGVKYLLEQKKVQTMRPFGNSSNNSSVPPLVSYCSPSRDFGVSKMAIKTEDDYSGTDGNPLNKCYWQIFSSNIEGNNPSKICLLVTVDYVCRFKGIEEQTPS